MTVRAIYRPTGMLHLVHAAGGPADGSLYRFITLCGRTIEDPEQWDEHVDQYLKLIGRRRTCRRCKARNWGPALAN